MRQLSLFFAWLIALIALIATLYSSEILNMAVCHLCWYQRICIYPLVILLGIGAFRDDRNVVIYALPLAILGACFALYQYLQQMIPGFALIELCGAGPSCSDIHFKLFGFITFPFLSLIASLAIAFLLLLSIRSSRGEA